MTTLHEMANKGEREVRGEQALDQGQAIRISSVTASAEVKGSERRQHRRHDIEQQGIPVDRWDGKRRVGKSFGQIVDISAGGVRIRTEDANVKPDSQIRVRLELPDYAGISPFVDSEGKNLEPKREWVGWMSVARVARIDSKHSDIAGRLVDMDEMDRGMLGLYLSTQPLAA